MKQALLFLKKKKQKNFCSKGDFGTPHLKSFKSFLLLFYKKVALAFLKKKSRKPMRQETHTDDLDQIDFFAPDVLCDPMERSDLTAHPSAHPRCLRALHLEFTPQLSLLSNFK